MEQAVGFVQFAALFFSWWGFFVGSVIGAAFATVVALGAVPVAYRHWRRRTLRRMWRRDEPRDLPISLMPQWGAYSLDDETVDRRCVCHNRRLFEGERVLLWPEIGPMGVLHTAVYCESVKEQV
jgi:hypothetical protein